MECEICLRNEQQIADLICPSCARSTIYLQRLEVAQVLLEKEQLHRKIQQVLQPHSVRDSTTEGEQDGQLRGKWSSAQQRAMSTRVLVEVKETQKHLSDLRSEIQTMKDQVRLRRLKLFNRRTELQSLVSQIDFRRKQQTDRIQEISAKGTRASKVNHDHIVEDKTLFCREVAFLLRLRQQQKRTPKGHIIDQYLLAGLLLPDLREINNVRCSDLTACLSCVAHLVVLVAFYLGVRLPAEITLPHRDYPLATINTPSNSYSAQRSTFPGSGAYMSSTNSPVTSRHEVIVPPRSRPLFVGSDDPQEKIAQLAKRDPAVFGFFIEGVSLLAWDVAWLARSQGLTTGTNTWMEVCNMGRILWYLLLAPKASTVNEDNLNRARSPVNHALVATAMDPSPGKLGATSHISATGFLGISATLDPMRGWSLSKFNVISDSLRKALLTEMNNAEWELLDAQEWDDGGEQFNDAVHIKNPTSASISGWDDARSIMTAKTHFDEDGISSGRNREESASQRGTSGWTKVKNREKAP